MNAPSPAVRAALADNLARVRGQIEAAVGASGRAAGAVTLVAVTKYIPTDWAAVLAAEGCHDLGESRPQELWAKAEALAKWPIRWHFIGHMQRNKLRRSLAVDRPLPLGRQPPAARGARRGSGRRRPAVAALLEVNISGDDNKGGFTPADVEPLVDRLGQFAHVEIQGLMGMAGLTADAAQAERQFAGLRLLRDQLLARLPAGTDWPHLSMGMSGDFEAAIRQGATLVRIGSALVEGLVVED